MNGIYCAVSLNMFQQETYVECVLYQNHEPMSGIRRLQGVKNSWKIFPDLVANQRLEFNILNSSWDMWVLDSFQDSWIFFKRRKLKRILSKWIRNQRLSSASQEVMRRLYFSLTCTQVNRRLNEAIHISQNPKKTRKVKVTLKDQEVTKLMSLLLLGLSLVVLWFSD